MACSSLLSDDDLRRFRTKPCRRNRQRGGSCEFGPDRCQYSHSQAWPRRCPFYLSNSSSIRYIPQVCPDVILSESENSACKTIGSVESNTCKRGGSCPFAHSLEEVLYHPLNYKTQVCPDFQHGECTTYYCPFIHGTAERRDNSSAKYNLPFTSDLFETSPFPNVEITPKIPSARMCKSYHPEQLSTSDMYFKMGYSFVNNNSSNCKTNRVMDDNKPKNGHLFQNNQQLPSYYPPASAMWNSNIQNPLPPHSLFDDSLQCDPRVNNTPRVIASGPPTSSVENSWGTTTNSESNPSFLPHFPINSFQQSDTVPKNVNFPCRSLDDSVEDLNRSIKALLTILGCDALNQNNTTKFNPKDSTEFYPASCYNHNPLSTNSIILPDHSPKHTPSQLSQKSDTTSVTDIITSYTSDPSEAVLTSPPRCSGFPKSTSIGQTLTPDPLLELSDQWISTQAFHHPYRNRLQSIETPIAATCRQETCKTIPNDQRMVSSAPPVYDQTPKSNCIAAVTVDHVDCKTSSKYISPPDLKSDLKYKLGHLLCSIAQFSSNYDHPSMPSKFSSSFDEHHKSVHVEDNDEWNLIRSRLSEVMNCL